MTKRLCVSTAALALALASAMLAPAVAADLSIAPIYKAPPAPPVATWSGSYLGVSGGGAWGNAVVRNDLTGADQTPRMDLSGGIVGLTSGFNIQRGPVVFGLEGDISATTKKGSAVEFPPNAVFHNEVRERWLSTFRGRIGYAQDNWLLYATGGAALANVESTVGSAAVGEISDKQWHWGWTAGGGVEVKLNQDWTAKVEYLYVGLQDKSYFNPAPSLAFPSSQRLNLSDHIVRFGVNYKLPWNILDSFFKP
jgi:outer membrane immunogenic protein